MDSAVRCRSLTKKYGKLTAVESLDLELKPGELFGLLGPNGAGKSTLVKMLAGLVHPTSGLAEVCGFPPRHPAAKDRIGYLPELFRFPPWMTGMELLELHGRLLGMEREQRRQRSTEVLELVGLEKAASRRIGQYSKGMQQRVGLAQAILGRPDIIFLDEPTSALDPVGRIHVRELLKYLSSVGTAVFLNSHMLTDVERICDRVAIMREGRIIRKGTLKEIAGRLSLFVKIDSIEPQLMSEIERRFGSIYRANGVPEFEVHLADIEQVAAVADLLVSRGRRIYELRPVTASLEELFLELFEGEEAR